MAHAQAARPRYPASGHAFAGVLLRALLLGTFAGLFGLVYLLGVQWLTDAIWPQEHPTGWFSGGIVALVVPVVAGLLVGLAYRVFRLPNRFGGFIDELKEGQVEPSTAPAAIGIAVISLVGGASLGPEAPMGTAGGAAGTWLARRDRADNAGVRQLTFVGISGAFGGLMSTPIGGPLLAFELEHDQTHGYYLTQLVPGILSGAVAFGIMWPVLGAPFAGLLSLDRGPFASWMLVAAVGLGVAGVVAALVVGRTLLALAAAFRRLDGHPVARGLVGGAIVGAIGFALPLTLFSGQTTLPVILDDAGQMGVVMLLLLAFAKAVTLGVSLGGGFYGGPVFPTFFMGGVLGVAVHALFPEIPLALAVGGIMAALGAAIALLPLSMAVLVAIMVQSGVEYFAAIVVAAATAYALRVLLTHPGEEGDMQRSSAAKP
jgi:H+/Cl- antiporter ClcA